MSRATEIRNFIARTEAALEFLPFGQPIPFDIGIAGMQFEPEPEPKRDFTLNPVQIGERFRITGCGYKGKQIHRVCKIRPGDLSDIETIDENDLERGVEPEQCSGLHLSTKALEIFQEKNCLTWYEKAETEN